MDDPEISRFTPTPKEGPQRVTQDFKEVHGIIKPRADRHTGTAPKIGGRAALMNEDYSITREKNRASKAGEVQDQIDDGIEDYKDERRIIRLDDGILKVDNNPDGQERLLGSITDTGETFRYTPQAGLMIDGSKGSAVLRPLDHIELDNGMGYETVESFFGNTDTTILSQKDFLARREAQTAIVRDKVGKLLAYANALGIQNDAFPTDPAHIPDIVQQERGRVYSRERLVTSYVDLVSETLAKDANGEVNAEQAQTMKDLFKESGILDFSIVPEGSTPATPTLFYVFAERFCKQRKLDYSKVENIKLALSKFPFYDELIHEYKLKADGRFGGSLLAVLNEQEHTQPIAA